MSHTVEKLLIIYHTEAEQWAAYLRSVFTGAISEADICCYDIATASNPRDDFLRLARYSCKLLILSEGVLDGLGQMWRFFLARVLRPAARVVVLLCGVESVAPLLELVPLNGDECLQISTEQDAHEYLANVMDIVRKGGAANVKLLTRKLSGDEQKGQTTAGHGIGCRTVLTPSRVPCGSSTEVFLLLKNAPPVGDSEVEFAGETQTLRAKPVHWNDRTLCVDAPDFPPGNVRVTLYVNGVPLSKAHLQYYSSMEEIACLLARVADPVDFMCQALQVSSVDELDHKLSSMLLEAMPTGGFPALQCENTPDRAELRHADVPTLLHFAARHGLKAVSGQLARCPGAERALCTPDRRGETPAEIARSQGHAELHVLLRETLSMSNPCEENGDAGVYEVMCAAGGSSTTPVQKEQRGEGRREEADDLYAALGPGNEHDTVLKPTKAVDIANRSPVPTPRPENHQVKDDGVPYITQVFQKKKPPQGNAEIYSLPTKQARGREPSVSSAYDTLAPEQMHGLQDLVELQQRVKAGSLTVDEALERFGDWKSAQKDAGQKEKSILNSRGDDDDSVYDKISTVHHAPSRPANERRRGSAPLVDGYYSNSLEVQHPNVFWKAHKP